MWEVGSIFSEQWTVNSNQWTENSHLTHEYWLLIASIVDQKFGLKTPSF
jgi:hypothetical protein